MENRTLTLYRKYRRNIPALPAWAALAMARHEPEQPRLEAAETYIREAQAERKSLRGQRARKQKWRHSA